MDRVPSLMLQDIALVQLIRAFSSPISLLQGKEVRTFQLGPETTASKTQHVVCRTYSSHFAFVYMSSSNILKKFDIFGHLHAQCALNRNVHDVCFVLENDKMFLLKTTSFNSIHGGHEPVLHILNAHNLCEETQFVININDRPKSMAIWGEHIFLLGFYNIYVIDKCGNFQYSIDLKNYIDDNSGDIVEYNQIVIHRNHLYLTFYGNVSFVQVIDIDLKDFRILRQQPVPFHIYRCRISPLSQILFLDLNDRVYTCTSDQIDITHITDVELYDGDVLPNGMLCVVYNNTCSFYK